MEEKSHVSYNVSEAFPDENKVGRSLECSVEEDCSTHNKSSLKLKLHFRMNSIFHKITVVPGVIGTSDNECEKLESPWRDSALTEIGCDSGNNGIDRIKNRSNSEWAYVLYTVPFRLC
ncbi:unnamed protein product [Rhizophagus irregularis]|nr:unnamed protein product [Rhizophagus irregularis]CAB5395716.1 unnamed protein product [Rhizophagus irregularis]